MTTENLDYFRRRNQEELAAAKQARDPAIAQIHNEMARRYRAYLGGDEPMKGNSGRSRPVGGALAKPRPLPA